MPARSPMLPLSLGGAHLRALLGMTYSEFDNHEGPRLRHCYPPNALSNELFEMYSDYVIVSKQITERIILVSLNDAQFINYPLAIDNKKYHRNTLTFAFGFVLKRGVNIEPYATVLKKIVTAFLDLEIEYEFLYHEPQQQRVRGFLEQAYHQLLERNEAFVAVPLTTSIPTTNTIPNTTASSATTTSAPTTATPPTAATITAAGSTYLALKLYKSPVPPSYINDFDVPIFRRDHINLTLLPWDVSFPHLLPHIDGISHVRQIVREVGMDAESVKRGLMQLLFHDALLIADVFKFSNVYKLHTEAAIALLSDVSLLEEMRTFAAPVGAQRSSNSGSGSSITGVAVGTSSATTSAGTTGSGINSAANTQNTTTATTGTKADNTSSSSSGGSNGGSSSNTNGSNSNSSSSFRSSSEDATDGAPSREQVLQFLLQLQPSRSIRDILINNFAVPSSHNNNSSSSSSSNTSKSNIDATGQHDMDDIGISVTAATNKQSKKRQPRHTATDAAAAPSQRLNLRNLNIARLLAFALSSGVIKRVHEYPVFTLTADEATAAATAAAVDSNHHDQQQLAHHASAKLQSNGFLKLTKNKSLLHPNQHHTLNPTAAAAGTVAPSTVANSGAFSSATSIAIDQQQQQQLLLLQQYAHHIEVADILHELDGTECLDSLCCRYELTYSDVVKFPGVRIIYK